MSDTNTAEKKTGIFHGKESSLLAQIIASVWIAGWSAFSFISGRKLDMGDIMLSGMGIAACFLPVYFSIIMDKIKEIKLGKGA